MINFRYHVVSLTAVFLALAIGLVLGSTVLNGPMLDYIETRVDTLSRDNKQLREQVSFLEEEVEQEQDFAIEAAPMLLEGTLTGVRVTLVVLPGGQDYTAGVADALELAGANLTGEVVLTDRFTNPQYRRGELLDLAHRVVPPSVDEYLPANSDGVETSAALLAMVLLDRGSATTTPEEEPAGDEPTDTATVPAEDRRTVLSAYAAAEFLEQPVTVSGPADAVVVVAGLPGAEIDAAERSEALFTAVAQFPGFGPVTIASSGVAGDGNLVAEVRGNPELAAQISTVDNASNPQGQIATGLTVATHLAGEVGHYGLGDGAERRLPTASSQ